MRGRTVGGYKVGHVQLKKDYRQSNKTKTDSFILFGVELKMRIEG